MGLRFPIGSYCNLQFLLHFYTKFSKVSITMSQTKRDVFSQFPRTVDVQTSTRSIVTEYLEKLREINVDGSGIKSHLVTHLIDACEKRIGEIDHEMGRLFQTMDKAKS